MTTAHRPTWKPAVGRDSGGGWAAGGASSGREATLDLASHTKLKFRKGIQVVDKKSALRESLLKLEEAERKSITIKRRQIVPAIEEEGERKLLKQTAEVDEERIRSKYNDDDEKGGTDQKEEDGWSDLDGDDDTDLDNKHNNSDDDSTDDDSDDDEEALQAELANIRSEREEAKRKEQEGIDAKNQQGLEEAALIGNPLLSSATTLGVGKMKRKWNDDVVFRNQAKNEPKVQKRFINDTIRNDFHKRFLDKFMI
mmetsp:Transcript_43834/g.49737  ORF Transcript_43834/g.49737 Transcript_43834/m.49737 type:complete len:254 (+) Transcript_43834:111-872(+)